MARTATTTGGSSTRTRLSPHVRPEHYALALELDPELSRRYRGSVRITLSLARAVRAIELHAVELSVAGASIELADGSSVGARIERLAEAERIAVVPRQRLPKGRVVLALRFSGRLRNDLRGLYFARSGKHRYAFSQLEAADARRFFPCFDEPAFKARFSLEVVTAARHAVISNSPQRSQQRLPGGLQRVRFAQTPLLSTYLVALAVGDLRASAKVRAGRTPIRIWHVPGQSRLTGFGLDAARQCLRRLERYFGVPYPYRKLDLCAVPDFEIGAMENAGAVFFRETLLLVDQRSASLGEKKRAIEVICHELAHMWYGNLVTMAWWDDLWLNEAFATWMAFSIVDGFLPELRMWNDFGHSRSSALDLDALASTHPIYAKVRTPEEATQSFDLITYEKGAAVIRMLERFLGARRFQRGVRAYIRRHREQNARAHDLWQALSAHAGEAVEEVVRPWIERPGFPLLRVKLSARAGKHALLLEQTRFSARGRVARGQQPWPIPVVVALGVSGGRRRTLRVLMKNARARIPLPRGVRFAYANAEEGGFYRPLHEPALLARLLQHRAELDSSERLGLVTHTWAAVHAGYAALDAFLDVACAFGDERDPDVLAALAPPLSHVLDQLTPGAGKDAGRALRRVLGDTFAPALAELGLRVRRGEDERTRLCRAELLGLTAVLCERADAVARAQALCAAYLRSAGSVEANLVGPALVVGARHGDQRVHAKYLAGSKRARTPQERRRLRMALAEFRDPACNARTLELCLTQAIPTQDVALLLARMLQNPAARERTWRFVRARWPELQDRVPAMLVGRLIEATPALQTDAHLRELLAFARKHPLPTATRALSHARERFAIDARLRARAVPQLHAWLERRARSGG